MNSCSKSLSTARSIIASTGCTPRSRATSATDGFGGSPLPVHADAFEVGRSGLRADAAVRRVVGVACRVDEPVAESRDRADRCSCAASGRARNSCHAGRRSKGTRVLNDSNTEMPRQCVCAMTRPPAAAASSRKSSRGPAPRIATKPNVIGTWLVAARSRHPGERARRVVRDRAPIMPPSAPSKMPAPRSPITSTSCTTSSHDASRERDRPIVGRLVVLAARRREADRAGADRVLELAGHRARGRRRSPRSSNARSPIAHVRSARVPDVRREVDALRQRVDRVEVLGKGLEAPVDAFGQRDRIDVFGPFEIAHDQRALVGSHRREREPAVAHHRGRHAVPARAAPARVPEHLRVHVRVAVDEAGRDDVTRRRRSRVAPRSRMRPTKAMRSPTTPTSARYEPRPEPSTTVPLRITRSYAMSHLLASPVGAQLMRLDYAAR